MTETIYKWLNADGTPCNGGSGRWHLPAQNPDGTWTPGKWMRRIPKIDPCQRGYHGCRAQDLIWWIGPTLWEMQYDGEYIEHADSDGRNSKVVGHSARLLRPVKTWNDRTARLCAADYAEHVLPVWTAQYPNDDRPAKAIEAARLYARGEIEASAAAASAFAASAIANARAAFAAAYDAAAYAAAYAAFAAANAVAYAAYYAVANAAANVATNVANVAAYAVAAADVAAERQWQSERLQRYIAGTLPEASE